MVNSIFLRSWIIISAIASLFFLTSCWTNQAQVQNSSVDDLRANPMEFVTQVPTRFTSDENFLSCTQQSIDMCMQEISFWFDAENSVTCDEFLHQESRDSCRFTEVTIQARDTQNAELCSTLHENFIQRCEFEVLFTMAVNTNDITLCQDLDEVESIDCNNRVVLANATTSLDVTVCDWIMKQEWEEDSFEQLACIEEVNYLLELQQITQDNWFLDLDNELD